MCSLFPVVAVHASKRNGWHSSQASSSSFPVRRLQGLEFCSQEYIAALESGLEESFDTDFPDSETISPGYKCSCNGLQVTCMMEFAAPENADLLISITGKAIFDENHVLESTITTVLSGSFSEFTFQLDYCENSDEWCSCSGSSCESCEICPGSEAAKTPFVALTGCTAFEGIDLLNSTTCNDNIQPVVLLYKDDFPTVGVNASTTSGGQQVRSTAIGGLVPSVILIAWSLLI